MAKEQSTVQKKRFQLQGTISSLPHNCFLFFFKKKSFYPFFSFRKIRLQLKVIKQSVANLKKITETHVFYIRKIIFTNASCVA